MILSASWWWLLALGALLPWAGPWRGRDAVQNVLRSLLFVVLAAALSQPYLRRDDAPAERMLILDLSASVDLPARDSAIDHAVRFAEAGSRDHTHLVLVGTDAGSETGSLTGAFGTITRLASDGPEGATPLSAAFARTNELIPRTGRGAVTFASDGLATRPDDARAIASLRARGVPVHVVALPVGATAPTPVALNWSGELRVGATARLAATVVAHGGAAPGQVQLRSGGKLLASAPYTGAEREVVALSFEPAEAGFIEAELVVVATADGGGDAPTGGSRASGAASERPLPAVLAVREPYRLLYFGHLQQNGAARLSKVLGPGFAVTEVDPADETDLDAALKASDLVILDDRPAETFPAEAERRVMNAVTHEGLGLVMCGGRGAFGSGGWHDRAIAAILPIDFVQKEEQRDPSTTLVIVIDTSGSMGYVRVQLAKEVARLAMRRLLPHDKVGIVEFYGSKRWAAPIQPASNAIELQRALNRMNAGGGTVIMPALEEAFYGLQNVDTRYKHVLVLTDAGVESGDYESLMRQMVKEGINVSTVLTGGGYHSEFLVNIANWGKGRFYDVPDRFNLPEIILKQPSTAKLPAYRQGMHRVRSRGGAGWWGDVQTRAIPQLAGYVESKARPGSEVLLETVEHSHPILTTWRYGLGRVTTLGTEPVGEGTRPWRDWSEYGRVLARVMERTAADTRDPFRFEVEYDGGEARLHAIRQCPRTGMAADAVPIARVRGADMPAGDGAADESALTFTARSPDHFIACRPVPAPGSVLRIDACASTSPQRSQPVVVASPVVAEQCVDPARGIDMAALAAATGGRVLSLDGDWSTANAAASGQRLLPLASWLFAAALILFIFELTWRRRPQAQARLRRNTDDDPTEDRLL